MNIKDLQKKKKKYIPTKISPKVIEDTQKRADKLNVYLCDYIELALTEFNKRKIV